MTRFTIPSENIEVMATCPQCERPVSQAGGSVAWQGSESSSWFDDPIDAVLYAKHEAERLGVAIAFPRQLKEDVLSYRNRSAELALTVSAHLGADDRRSVNMSVRYAQ